MGLRQLARILRSVSAKSLRNYVELPLCQNFMLPFDV